MRFGSLFIIFIGLSATVPAFAIAADRTPFWAEEHLSIKEIARRVEALDPWGNADLPVAEPGDRKTAFGTVIKSNCSEGFQDLFEAMLALAIVRTQDCKRALWLPDMKRFIAVFRRAQVHCSDQPRIGVFASAHTLAEENPDNRFFKITFWGGTRNKIQQLLTEIVTIGDKRGYLRFVENAIAEAFFHEILHFLPHNQRSDHGRDVVSDRIYFLSSVCFPMSSNIPKDTNFDQVCRDAFDDADFWVRFLDPENIVAKPLIEGQARVICERAKRFHNYVRKPNLWKLLKFPDVRPDVFPELFGIRNQIGLLMLDLVRYRWEDWKQAQLEIDGIQEHVAWAIDKIGYGCRVKAKTDPQWDVFCRSHQYELMQNFAKVSSILSDPLYALATRHYYEAIDQIDLRATK